MVPLFDQLIVEAVGTWHHQGTVIVLHQALQVSVNTTIIYIAFTSACMSLFVSIYFALFFFNREQYCSHGMHRVNSAL